MSTKSHHEVDSSGVVENLYDRFEEQWQGHTARVIGDEHQHPLTAETAFETTSQGLANGRCREYCAGCCRLTYQHVLPTSSPRLLHSVVSRAPVAVGAGSIEPGAQQPDPGVGQCAGQPTDERHVAVQTRDYNLWRHGQPL